VCLLRYFRLNVLWWYWYNGFAIKLSTKTLQIQLLAFLRSGYEIEQVFRIQARVQDCVVPYLIRVWITSDAPQLWDMEF